MMIRALFVASALLVLGCGDRVSVAKAKESASDRAEGFQSLDDESQASRLYYQFVDERGQVRFVESLDEVPATLRSSVGFVKMASAPPMSPGDAHRVRVAHATRSGGPLETTRKNTQQIVLYSADWCGVCTRAKRYLAERHVAYEERNVDIPAYAEEVFKKTGARGIPVIDVGGRMLTGFSARLYDELIDQG